MGLPIDHGVNLIQVYMVGLEQLDGPRDLSLASFLALGPDFCRHVELVAPALSGRADDLLSVSVCRGAVDEVNIIRQAVIDDLASDGYILIRCHVKCPQCSEPNCGYFEVSEFSVFQVFAS